MHYFKNTLVKRDPRKIFPMVWQERGKHLHAEGQFV